MRDLILLLAGVVVVDRADNDRTRTLGGAMFAVGLNSILTSLRAQQQESRR